MRRLGRILLFATSLAFCLQILIALLGIPPFLYTMVAYAPGPEVLGDPKFVVVLGGGGIPSESGLIRTYCAATIGKAASNATFVVSLPAESNPITNSVGRMRDELVMRGVSSNQVLMEYKALNTHEQAVNIAEMLGSAALDENLMIVTSPYHMRRAVMCFRKAGFRNIIGVAAVSIGPEADVGKGVLLRYAFWANLQAENEIAREICALIYYQVKDWI